MKKPNYKHSNLISFTKKNCRKKKKKKRYVQNPRHICSFVTHLTSLKAPLSSNLKLSLSQHIGSIARIGIHVSIKVIRVVQCYKTSLFSPFRPISIEPPYTSCSSPTHSIIHTSVGHNKTKAKMLSVSLYYRIDELCWQI